ncbi:hypothetical protein FFLO_01119 [Filobasidium floriforme]|uniref:HAM1-like N-terminal domain-containing protein n=1 Tax=Filobasidium floriforme TaxID=5210 RepID=A0A8K0JQ60_9TREE|nr:hypothetical protein FFLO_01119 [Filobasidium floriforme]
MSSETAPLLPTSVRSHLPSQSQVQSKLPSKQQRIQVSQSVGALKAGKFPSQDQVSRMIDVVVNSDVLKSGGGPNSRTARLGEEGTRLSEDFKNVLRCLKKWGEEKNGDDLLQNLFHNASHIDYDVEVGGPSVTMSGQAELAQDSMILIRKFISLAQVMITSPSFRKLGSDIILLSRDILADAAEMTAESASEAAKATRPSEQEREQGLDYDKIKDKGKVHAKHTVSGLYQAQAKEEAFDKGVALKNYLDEKLPAADEAKDALINRMKDMISHAQTTPEYKESMDTLIHIAKKYMAKAQEAAEEVKDKSDASIDEDRVQQAGKDLKTFVERLAGKSLDPVVEAGQKASEDIRGDPKLTAYFEAIEEFMDRCMNDPKYVTSQRAYRKASSLYDDGQSLIKNNPTWKSDADKLRKEVESFFNALSHDKTSGELVDAIETFGEDSVEAGHVGWNSLKSEGRGLYRDAVDVILPRLVGLVKEIPVPRIEFKSADVDLVIDDLTLESASFIPDSIKFVAHNDFEFVQGYATYASDYDSSVRLRVKGLHVQAKDIAYWFHKKSGWVTFEDSGLLDVQFGPKGISFDVVLENADEDSRETFFKVKSTKVSIVGFDYQIKNNDHWMATWLAKAPVRAILLQQMTQALELQIAESLRQADFELYGLQQRTIAATNARPSPANYLKAVFSTSVFGSGPSLTKAGSVKPTSKGLVKYGKRGEYVLHVGVDEELFPNKPAARVRNSKRDHIRAKVDQGKGLAGTAQSRVKKDADKAKSAVRGEASTMSRAARQQERRESRSEGWRSDVFDV